MPILKLLTNKVLLFILSKYFAYFVQFINSIFIAVALGPYYLGIWGFITLVLQYLSYTNFGVQYSLNVLLSTGNEKSIDYKESVVGNTIILTLIFGLIIIISYLIVYFFDISIFSKYEFSRYFLYVIIISVLNNLNQLFLNLYRTYASLVKVGVFLNLIQIPLVPFYFIFKDGILVYYLLYATIGGHLVSLIMYWINPPVRINFRFDRNFSRRILSKGIKLLFYNVSYYLIMLSSRTIVSSLYEVEEMGFYSFASNLASAAILLLSSIGFVLYPKILSKLKNDVPDNEAIKFITDLRNVYVTTAYLLVLFVVSIFPFVISFFKQYKNITDTFTFIIIAQLIIASGFGYSGLIIARGKEMYLAVHAIITVLINTLLGIISSVIFKLPFAYIAMVMFICFIYYQFQTIRYGKKLLNENYSFVNIIKELFWPKNAYVILLLIIGSITKMYYIFYIFALLSFIIINFNGIKSSVKVGLRVLSSKKAFSLN